MNDATKFRLLDNLFNLFLDAKYLPEDDTLFKDWDIEIDSLLKRNMALFRQLKTQTKAELYRAKYERVVGFLANLKRGVDSKQQEYLELAEKISTKPRFAELQPFFRNLTNLSERDKQAIVMDAKLLDLLADIEEELSQKKHE